MTTENTNKTLFINHTNDVFGAESVLLHLIEVCVDDKNQISVVEPNRRKNSTFRQRIQQLGCNKIKQLPYKNLGGSLLRSYIILLFYNFGALIYLWFYIKKNKIDIIYSNTSTTGLGIMLAILLQKKHIWHIHEPTDPEHGWNKSLVSLYKLLFAYKKNVIVFVSKTQQKQWLEFIPTLANKSIVIYNPIKEYSISQDKKKTESATIVFGYLGSRDKRKNLTTLLTAFKELLTHHENISLLLPINLGDCNEQNAKQILDTGLSHKVKEIKVIDAAKFYNEIDVFILPSLSETWGLVILEAILVKKPTILTQNTGLKELLKDNVHTLFFNPLDSNSLVIAMEKMLNKAYRDEIAIQGYEFIKQCKFNENFKKHIQEILT